MRPFRTRVQVMGEFSSAEALLRAVERLRAAGYRRLEAYSPFEIPGLSAALGLERPRLSLYILICGLLGCLFAYWIQWYANVWNYLLIVGNRPIHPVLAFIPATFEGTVLGASLGAFFGLLAWTGLPTLWHPVFEIEGFERTTIDRFWITAACGTDERDAEQDAEHGERVLAELGALRVVRLRETP